MVVTLSGAAMRIEKERVDVPPLAPVTFTSNDAVPVAVGVPEIVPPLESERPAGSAPEAMDQVYGDAPPEALSVVVV